VVFRRHPVSRITQIVGLAPRLRCTVAVRALVRAPMTVMGRTIRADPFTGMRRSVALSRMLVVPMGLIVLSFLTAFAAGRLRGRSIDRDLGGIIDNAIPSVMLLSSTRGDLHRLDSYTDAFVDAAAESVATPVEPIARYRRAIDSALDEYRALPTFPGEPPMGEELVPALSAMDAALAQVLAAVNDADMPGAEKALQDEQRLAERTDTLLERLIDRDGREGRGLGLAIRLKRQRAIRTVAAIDAVAVLLSLAATALAAWIVRRSVRALEDKADELSNFAGRVAHDVTSPISSLGLSLEILARRASNDPLAQATAARGLSSVRRASRIAHDLLEFSRAGARPDRSATADVKSVLEDVVDGLKLEALAARVQLRCHPVASCTVACSPGVLTSLVSNLVRNAIQHMGDATERRVEVGAIALADRRRVEVSDTGPGVAPALREQLFEPFVRGQTASSGVGLGLATVRRLAEAHHGGADFRSEPGLGSVFWFEIPVGPRPVRRLSSTLLEAARAWWPASRGMPRPSSS
jgi:signal transduction histidine kinase